MFVLKSANSVFVWKGAGASQDEMLAAKHVVSSLGGSASDVAEGKEPGEDPSCSCPPWGNCIKSYKNTLFLCGFSCSWILVSSGRKERLPDISNSEEHGQTTTPVRLLQQNRPDHGRTDSQIQTDRCGGSMNITTLVF